MAANNYRCVVIRKVRRSGNLMDVWVKVYNHNTLVVGNKVIQGFTFGTSDELIAARLTAYALQYGIKQEAAEAQELEV